jgi:RNA polymerase sigma factor (sigma-70 family)
MPRSFLFRLFAAAVPAGDHVPDGELLRRFAADRDSAAFELIVRRHADAVWSAALRIVRNEADADDVFQATFLALVRKAGAVRGACVGGWLHRVAVHAALKLKARRTRSVSDGVAPAEAAAPTGPDPELAAVVHEELARLPERYRLPVVLCDLEGQTHAEAAKTLGWPVGSVSGRLSRARDILRDRLTRRGFAAPAALVAVAAPEFAVQAAAALACGAAAASPAAVALTEGVLTAMRTAKLKITAAVLAATGMLALAGAGGIYALADPPAPAIPGELPIPEKAEPVKVVGTGTDITAFPDLTKEGEKAPWDDPTRCPLLFGPGDLATDANDTPYAKLLKARVNLLRQALQQQLALYQKGQSDGTAVGEVADRLVGAAMELEIDPKKKIPWLRERVIVLHALEAIADARRMAARGTGTAVLLARERRLAAESDLLLFTAPPPKPKGGR